MKSKVYVTRPSNIQELKDRIRAAFAEITVEMRKKAAPAYRERLEKVIENGGVTSRSRAELKVNGFVQNLDKYNPKLACVKIWSNLVTNKVSYSSFKSGVLHAPPCISQLCPLTVSK